MIFILSCLNSFFFNFVIIKSIPAIFLILFSLIIGIIISFYNPILFELQTIIYVILFCSANILITTVIWGTKQILFSFILCINFIFVGFLVSDFKNAIEKETYFAEQNCNYFIGKVKQKPIEKENSFQVLVEIIQNEKKVLSGKTLVYLKKDKAVNELEYGDLLKLKNKFNPIKSNNNPFEFDYKRYLKIHNIHHQTFLKNGEWEIIKKGEWSILRLIIDIRSKLDDLITNSELGAQNKNLAKALLLGEKEHLDKETLQSFSSAGAMHVLAVSGLHVGIIMLILQFILKPIKQLKFGRQINTALVISGVWLYALITGFSPSVIRAALMFSFIIFGSGLQRHISVYQSISVSAFIILIFDPFSLFKVGFQLSYLAVLGIVYIQPKLYKTTYISNKMLNYLWQITTVSIAAQIATFPLGLYYFHQFPNLFLISNIIVIPLAGVLLSIGFIYFATHFLSPLKVFFEIILDHIFSFLNFMIIKIENIPFSIIWGISISWVETFLLYLIIITSTIFLTLRRKVFVYISLSLVCIFLFIQLVEQKNIRKTETLTIYNIRGDLAIDIFIGKQNTFICSPSLLKNESKLLFHVRHHWFKIRGNKLPEKIITINYSENRLITFKNQTILILLDTKVAVPITNYVIIQNVKYISKKVTDYWLKNNTVLIIHPDIPYKTEKYLTTLYPDSLIYSLEDKGAFQINYR